MNQSDQSLAYKIVAHVRERHNVPLRDYDPSVEDEVEKMIAEYRESLYRTPITTNSEVYDAIANGMSLEEFVIAREAKASCALDGDTQSVSMPGCQATLPADMADHLPKDIP
jgi:hypothetical protein